MHLVVTPSATGYGGGQRVCWGVVLFIIYGWGSLLFFKIVSGDLLVRVNWEGEGRTRLAMGVQGRLHLRLIVCVVVVDVWRLVWATWV